jgi:hypothetical protein
MQLRFVLPALLIGAGLFLPVQTPATAKSYKQHKFKKYKVSRKMKGGKHMKGHKSSKYPLTHP